jgi:hypothetical protein
LRSRSHVLIGNESLLVHCGNALVDEGHSVAAVVSETPEIRAWADARQVRSLATLAELEADAALRYDLLFSVGNLAIVPPGSCAVRLWAVSIFTTGHSLRWEVSTRRRGRSCGDIQSMA